MARTPLAVKFSTEGFDDLRKQLSAAGKSFDDALGKAKAASQEAIAESKRAGKDLNALAEAEKAFERAARQANNAVAGSFRELRVKSTADINAQKQAAISAFDAIKKSGTASAQDIANAQVALKNRLKELDGQLDQTKGKVDDVTDGFTVFKGVLSNLISGGIQAGLSAIAGLIQNVARGLVGLGQQAISVFMQFDGAIKNFAAKSGAGADQIKKVSDEAKKLGMETSKTPAQIAATAAELAAAGFSADQTAKALRGIVMASEASGESLQTAGEIVGATINQFRMQAEDSAKIANVLAAGANASATSIGGLGEGLKYIGPIAGGANQKIEDMVVVLGMITNAGMEAGQAGRNFTSAFERIQMASAGISDGTNEGTAALKAQQKALEKLGVQFRDVATGQMRPFLEVLPELAKKFNALQPGDQDLIRKQLFGTEGGRAIMALLSQVDTKMEGIVKAVYSANEGMGTAAETSQQLMQGLGPALELLQSSWEVVLQNLGEAMAPAMDQIVRLTTSWVNELVKTTGLFDGIAAISKKITEFFEKNPEIVKAINAEMTALVKDALQSASDLASQLLDYLTQNPKAIAETIREVATLAGGALKAAVGLAKAILDYFKENGEVIGKIGKAMGGILNLLGQINRLGNTVTRPLVGAILGMVTRVVDGIASTIVSVKNFWKWSQGKTNFENAVPEFLRPETEQGKKAAKSPSGVVAKTGGATNQDPFTRGRSTGAHLHVQSVTGGLSEAQIRALMDEFVRVNGKRPSSFGESRASKGHGYTAIDYLTPQGGNITLLGGATIELYHKGGKNGGLMGKLITPKGSVELGHLLELNPPKVSQSASTQSTPAAQPVVNRSPSSVQPMGASKTVKASFYGGPTDPTRWHGRKTASGEVYDENALTVAVPYRSKTDKRPSIPFGTNLQVTNPANGKQVVVRVTDTGNFGTDAQYGGRGLDLSYGAAKALGTLQAGVANVVYQVLSSAGGAPVQASTGQSTDKAEENLEKEREKARQSALKRREQAQKIADQEAIADLKHSHEMRLEAMQRAQVSEFDLKQETAKQSLELRQLETKQAIAQLKIERDALAKLRAEKIKTPKAQLSSDQLAADYSADIKLVDLQIQQQEKSLKRTAEKIGREFTAIAEDRAKSEAQKRIDEYVQLGSEQIQADLKALDLAAAKNEISQTDLSYKRAILEASQQQLEIDRLEQQLSKGLVKADDVNAQQRRLVNLKRELATNKEIAEVNYRRGKAEQSITEKAQLTQFELDQRRRALELAEQTGQINQKDLILERSTLEIQGKQLEIERIQAQLKNGATVEQRQALELQAQGLANEIKTTQDLTAYQLQQLEVQQQQASAQADYEQVSRLIQIAEQEGNYDKLKSLELLQAQLDLERKVAEIKSQNLTEKQQSEAIAAEYRLYEFQVEEIQNGNQRLGESFRELLSGPMSEFFQSAISGTQSIGEAFGAMAQSILNSLAQIGAELATSALLNLLGVGKPQQQGGLGGAIANLFGSFASGGYTGNGGQYEPAGVVHGGEFVLNRRATKTLGVPLLSQLNRLPGYAQGGYVALENRLLAGLNAVPSPRLSLAEPATRTGDRLATTNTVTVNINDKESRFYRQSRTLARELADELRG